MRFALTLAALVLAGCGIDRGTATPQLYSLDGVKWLRSGQEQGQDPASFLQPSYLIDSTHHLLLRFERLQDQMGGVDLSPGKKVLVQVSVPDPAQAAVAAASLQLCPITRSWMMLASWSFAHLFGEGGRWKQAGGDWDVAGCRTGTVSTGDGHVLAFDVTQWFTDYPRARGVNYGLILISAAAVTVVGDTSGSYSPRIAFDHFDPVPLDRH